ncbi:ABC transporter substrate-binding protein [Colwellia sp. RSH04]|uniref:ABC transporter substrate-binding protein n=1 Tax=Colwellia sp. RSH04 TaxID=2305464 RepID=UPI000E581FD9|nr:ABC transporter substrate-binding protein [Colwellia sp. RSH04]RHW76600.1 hypothetical protein D1094_05790 [Colwellia sp. RSH04]
MRTKLTVFLIIISLFSCRVNAINVTYIADTNEITPFWQNVHDIAQAAAQDLNINLTFVRGEGHRLYQDEVIKKIVEAKTKPDLLIFMAHKRSALRNFTLLEQAKIPFVTLSHFTYKDNLNLKPQIGYPQEKFKFWLGEHYDDHTQGAYLLMNNLLTRAKKVKPDNPLIKVLAINGDFAAQSLQKTAGFTKSVNEDNQAILVQNIVAYWDYDKAEDYFINLYRRHKGIDVVLAASDHMAVAAIEGAKDIGLIPNKDIFIGGFDWDRKAIRGIKQEQLTASAGGHIYSVAWLMAKVYDHFQTKTVFHPGIQSPSSEFSLIDIHNVNAMEKLTYQNDFFHINFYCFTQTYTKESVYNFSINALNRQINRASNHTCH